METRPEGAQLFHAGGRTDRHDEALIAFRNFANAHKKINNHSLCYIQLRFSKKCHGKQSNKNNYIYNKNVKYYSILLHCNPDQPRGLVARASGY
jgi:hypothetical protein